MLQSRLFPPSRLGRTVAVRPARPSSQRPASPLRQGPRDRDGPADCRQRAQLRLRNPPGTWTASARLPDDPPKTRRTGEHSKRASTSRLHGRNLDKMGKSANLIAENHQNCHNAVA